MVLCGAVSVRHTDILCQMAERIELALAWRLPLTHRFPYKETREKWNVWARIKDDAYVSSSSPGCGTRDEVGRLRLHLFLDILCGQLQILPRATAVAARH